MIRESSLIDGTDDEVDIEIQNQYKKYVQNKNNGTQTIKKREILKENIQQVNSPDITFGKIKEIGKAQENLTRLTQLMGCRSYQQALIKVDQMRKNEKFIDAVLEMTRKCAPNEENTLHTSWRIIKDAISAYYTHHSKGES